MKWDKCGSTFLNTCKEPHGIGKQLSGKPRQANAAPVLVNAVAVGRAWPRYLCPSVSRSRRALPAAPTLPTRVRSHILLPGSTTEGPNGTPGFTFILFHMHIPYVWQLTAENSQRLFRYLKLSLLRRVPHLHFHTKAWSS